MGAYTNIDRGVAATLGLLLLCAVYNMASVGQPIERPLHWVHAGHLLVGVFVALCVMAVHYRKLETLAIPIFIGAIVLLCLTSAFGKIVNGSRRWLDLGVTTLQTSDLAKVALVLVLARVLKRESFDGDGMTLRELVRPMNLSRPVSVILVSLVLFIGGDHIRRPKIEAFTGKRYRPVARLSAATPEHKLGRERTDDVSVAVPYGSVSPEHARIYRLENGVYIIEPSGESPVFVNEAPVASGRRLRHGDEIQLGLSSRAKLRLAAPMQFLRPKLPLFLVVGVVWLFFAIMRCRARREVSSRDWVAPIDVVLLPALLILAQPDLGTAIVLGLIAASMIFYVGLSRRSYAFLGTLGLLGLPLAWLLVLEPYQKERVLSFLNPSENLAGSGYHQHQSLIAIGSGRFWGKGHGLGTQTQYSFVPEQHSDFIFPPWAEEQGLLGAGFVVLLFLLLFLFSIRVAQRAWDRFGALLVIGMTSILFWHTLINLLMVLRLAPVVGVPLPFWSSGGSFVLTAFLAIGIILNVSMRRTIF